MNMSTVARMNMRHRERKVMAYYDDGGPGKGNCTFGIGSLAHYGPCTSDELANPLTDAQVETAFLSRVKDAERAVEREVKVELTHAQFDALISFTFNRGATGAKPVYKLLNAGDFQGAANRISSEVYGHEKRKGKVVKVMYRGLVLRRIEESAPFRSAK